MNLQRISFQREQGGEWERGVAKVKEHGVSDVDWIVDQYGLRVDTIWHYRLIEGPMAYMSV